MRLIDADALKEKILKERDAIPTTRTERYGFGVEFSNPHGESMRGGIRKALRCMEQTPTIDAVPVVRCKDCKFQTTKAHTSVGFCEVWQGYNGLGDEGYCVYGERRENDGVN